MKARFRGQKGSPLSARPKRSCYVKTRRQLWWRKENSGRKDEHVAWLERQMMLVKRMIHLYRVSLYTTFQRMSLNGQNVRVLIVDMEILLFNVVGRILRTGFKDACYEHISPVQSGKHNQWLQLKRMLIKGSVPTPNTIVQHSLRLTFRKWRMVSS